MVEKVGEGLVEGAPKMDFDQIEVAVQGADKGARLVFVSGLAVGEDENPVHAVFPFFSNPGPVRL